MEKRKFKVYEGCSGRKGYVPMIRLQGLWLEDPGFRIGRKMRAECQEGEIVITLEEED